MAEEEICQILDILAEEYNQGCYPGRNSEGLNPEWPADPFHVLVATILSQRTKDDNTRKASDNLFHNYDSIEAIASADVVLRRSNLSDAVSMLRLGRAALRNMKQNLFWALIYNTLCIPVAAGVLSPIGITLSPWIAAFAMSCSSLFVVLNALRLRRFK
jgi:Flp pilus assembly protein TadB